MLLLMSVICSGCGLFKKTTVDISKTHLADKSKSSQVVDSSYNRADKTVTVEHERADTIVKSKGIKVSSTKHIANDDLINGLMAIDSGLVQVHLQYDTLSKTLKTSVTVKPQDIPVFIDKSKTTYTDIAEAGNKKVEATQSHDVALDEKIKHKEKEPAKMGVWLIAVVLGVLAIIAGVIWYFRKKV